MAGQLLILGDLHLGRRPLQVPTGMDARALGPEEAWRRSVDLALQENVAALLLAGDVVEGLHDRFEAERILRPGIERLHARGIATIAVLGNHDVHALPRLRGRIPGLEILGRAGWELRVLEHEGQPFCQLLGWSFRESWERENPLNSLRDLELPLDPRLASLGLLHCDLDAQDSRYAPVSRSDFEVGPAGRLDAFFLGHIHRPQISELRARRPVGYLGSVVGLSPKEDGPHGPWLVDVAGPGKLSCRQVDLAPLRYETCELDLDGLDLTEIADIEDALLTRLRVEMRARAASIRSESRGCDLGAIRVELRGRVARPDIVGRALERLIESEALKETDSDMQIFCASFRSELLPRLDLDGLANSPGALGSLLRRWSDPKARSPEALSNLEGEIRTLLGKNCWRDLDDPELVDLDAEIASACRELLVSMLIEQEQAG